MARRRAFWRLNNFRLDTRHMANGTVDDSVLANGHLPTVPNVPAEVHEMAAFCVCPRAHPLNADRGQCNAVASRQTYCTQRLCVSASAHAE